MIYFGFSWGGYCRIEGAVGMGWGPCFLMTSELLLVDYIGIQGKCGEDE